MLIFEGLFRGVSKVGVTQLPLLQVFLAVVFAWCGYWAKKQGWFVLLISLPQLSATMKPVGWLSPCSFGRDELHN